MGPIAQIAASLAYPVNDNFQSVQRMEEAIDLMNSVLDRNPDAFDTQTAEKLFGMMEDSMSWDDIAGDDAKQSEMEKAKKRLKESLQVFSNTDS